MDLPPAAAAAAVERHPCPQCAVPAGDPLGPDGGVSRTGSASQFLGRRGRALAAFTPSMHRPDPSTVIPGVVVQRFAGGEHVTTPGAIPYRARPPYGGPHGLDRATGDGVAYPQPVRDANAVHAL